MNRGVLKGSGSWICGNVGPEFCSQSLTVSHGWGYGAVHWRCRSPRGLGLERALERSPREANQRPVPVNRSASGGAGQPIHFRNKGLRQATGQVARSNG